MGVSETVTVSVREHGMTVVMVVMTGSVTGDWLLWKVSGTDERMACVAGVELRRYLSCGGEREGEWNLRRRLRCVLADVREWMFTEG